MNREKYHAEISGIKANDTFKKETKELLKNKVKSRDKEEKHRKKNIPIKCGVAAFAGLVLIGGLYWQGQQNSGSQAMTEKKNKQTVDAANELGNLPKLKVTFVDGAMGYEGLMAYDIKELIGNNPWNEDLNLKQLPVYKNEFQGDPAGLPLEGLNEQEMLAKGEEVARKMGIAIEEQDLDEHSVTLKGKDIEIRACIDGRVGIFFDPYIRLISKETNIQEELENELRKGMEQLLKKYNDFISFETPRYDLWGDYTFDGERFYTMNMYEGKGSIEEQIVAYNLQKVSISLIEENQLYGIWLNNRDLTEVVGNYPIISVEEATKLYLGGKAYTTVPEDVSECGKIAHVELMYRTSAYDEYFMPFYKFYIELPLEKRENGLNTYGIYYVPAIEASYLEVLPEIEVKFN